MPSPRILKALGMTRRQWGALPPEREVDPINGSDDRNNLRKKAQAIMDAEDNAAAAERNREREALRGLPAFTERVARLEARVSVLEGGAPAPVVTPAPDPEPPAEDPTEGGPQ